MYNFIKEAHNGTGMIILLIMLAAIIMVFIHLLMKEPMNRAVRVSSLIALIAMHSQLIVGGILYLLSPVGLSNLSGAAMGHKISRFYAVEHPVGMILAIVLVTIGYRISKRKTENSQRQYRQMLVFYLLGFGIMTYLIPWFLWQ